MSDQKNQVQLMRVVVASPGDVQAERDLLAAVIDELNRGIAAERGLHLVLSRWETDARPGFHPEGPQGLIDPILNITDCDLLIGIFWKRFGTPVKDADSGTEHEFRLAYKAWKETGRPQIFVYFNHQPYAPQSSAEAEQWLKVLAFKESFPTEGLWWSYAGEAQFERLARIHLTQFIRNLPKPEGKRKRNSARSSTAQRRSTQPARSNEELSRAYRDDLAERVSTVRLLGEAESRPLEKVFVELTIIEDYQRPRHNAEILGLMDAEMRRRQDVFASDDEQRPDREGAPVKRTLKPDELLRGNAKAVITGAPGAGKTTLARYLAGKALKDENRFPVFLELKAVTARAFDEANGDLAELLFNQAIASRLDLSAAERQSFKEFFRQQLQKGAAIFLDGLDEVSGTEFFNRLRDAVKEFSRKYRHSDLLITTRPYAIQSLIEGLKVMEIAHLSDRQIADFLEHYYGDDERWRQFERELKHVRGLREMARVPLLLGFIVQLWCERGAVAGNRLELYRQVVQMLVVRLDEEKNLERKFQIVDPDGAIKGDFLRHLAFARLFDESVRRDAERLVFTGEQIAEEARRFCHDRGLHLNPYLLAADVKKTPLLREVGADEWAFIHLTLHEYLAAAALARRDDCEQILCRAYFDRTLVEMEVLPMTLGLVSQPDTLYEALEQLPDSLSYANLRLRARGLAYGAKVSQPFLEKLVVHLSQFIPDPVSLKDPYADAVFLSFSSISGKALDDIVDFIAPFLHKRDSYDCGVAAEILGKLGGEKAVNVLIETVKTGTAGVSADAAEALGEIGDERALDVLLELLNTDSSWKTGVALGKISGEKALQGLVNALKSDNSNVRFNAILGLWGDNGDQVVDALLEALNDEYEIVRWWAAIALGDAGSKRAVDGLIQALRSDDNQLRWHAAVALGDIGGEKAIEALLSSLGSDNYYERTGAALALGQLGIREVTDVLFGVLKKDNDNRWNASSALARIGGEQVVEGLIEVLNEKDPYLSRHAARALAMIGSHKAKESLHAALKANDKYLPLRAALELAAIGDKLAVEVLVNALDWETDEGGRRKIIEALGEVGDARAVAGLVEELSTNNISLRRRAAKLLEEMPQEALVEGLFESLSHQNSFVRKKAAEVICYYAL
jgi:HEAT repeat protein/predicted ATPase